MKTPTATARSLKNGPLNLRQIEVFHAIMVTGSLSEAGRLLCVSQPAVSRVLATAENRLRFQLFDRVKGRLQPTPEARELFSEVEAIQEGVGRLNSRARSLIEGEGGELRIVCSPSYGEWLIPRAINSFRARHPDVRIKYRPLPLDSLVPHVLLGHADVGITAMLPPPHPHLVTREIGQGGIFCVMPPGHPLCRNEIIRPPDMVGQTFISYGRDTPFGISISSFLRSAESEIPIDIEVRSSPEACALVRQGVGVALIDSYCVSSMTLGGLVVRPIAPAIDLKTYVLSCPSRPASMLARGFLTTFRHVLQREMPDELSLFLDSQAKTLRRSAHPAMST